ncbi:MAG: aspartate aminotransferase family protein, partial [Verrucomicrobiota bacterium]
ALGAELEQGMVAGAKAARVPVRFQRIGSMFCAYFTERPVWNLDDAMHSDRARFARFFHGMLDRGVYLAPSQFEAGFLSTAHTSDDIETTLRAAEAVFATL